MKFTHQKLPTAFAPAASSEPPFDEADRPSIQVSARCVIDFFEARDRLSAQLERTAKESAFASTIRRTTIRRKRAADPGDTLEESLYWLISAATLAYLVLGILGL